MGAAGRPRQRASAHPEPGSLQRRQPGGVSLHHGLLQPTRTEGHREALESADFDVIIVLEPAPGCATISTNTSAPAAAAGLPSTAGLAAAAPALAAGGAQLFAAATAAPAAALAIPVAAPRADDVSAAGDGPAAAPTDAAPADPQTRCRQQAAVHSVQRRPSMPTISSNEEFVPPAEDVCGQSSLGDRCSHGRWRVRTHRRATSTSLGASASGSAALRSVHLNPDADEDEDPIVML